MITLLVPVLLMVSSAVPPASSRPIVNRVYFAPIDAGPGADAGTISVFEQRLLASARRHRDLEVVGAQDVQALLDHEATRQQGGCDEGGIACAAELAGALDAPRMVTGQLGRVGSTWVLSLTLIERGTLNVIGRSSRQRKGETPEDLLSDVDGMIDEVLGAAAAATALAAPAWSAFGTVGIVGGTVGLVVGGGALAWTWLNFTSSSSSIREAKTAAAAETIRSDARQLGSVLNTTAVVGLVVGTGLLATGGALALFATSEEP